MKKKLTQWVCTDPDTHQYGRQLSDTQFEFREGGKHETIDLNEYTSEEIENCINSYGYTLYTPSEYNRNIHELYEDSANWIIAECLFEEL